MAIEYRNPSEDELRASCAAASVAFAEELRDDDFELFRTELPADRAFSAFDDAVPVGFTASIAFEMTIPGGAAPCAGITFVGVMPSHRRRGVLTELMRKQLGDLHERGEPLAALWASEPVIYGRFGYGISAPAAALEAVHAGFAFRDDPGPVAGPACCRRRRPASSSRPSSSEHASSETACSRVQKRAGTAASPTPSTGVTARARSTTS